MPVSCRSDRPPLRPIQWALPIALAAALALGACGRNDGPPPQPSPTAIAHANPEVPAAIVIAVNGEKKEVLVYRGKPQPLLDHLPAHARTPKHWKWLEAHSEDGRRLMLRRFTDRYPSHDIALFLDPKDRPCVGVFRRIRDDMPAYVKKRLEKPQLSLVDAAEISVRINEQAVADVPLAVPLTLSWFKPGAPAAVKKQVSEEDLSQLLAYKPFAQERRGKGGQARGRTQRGEGWRLLDVVALATAGKVSSVTLVNQHGERLKLEAADLYGSSIDPLLRHNRRKLLGCDVWRPNEKRAEKRLRQIVKIEIR